MDTDEEIRNFLEYDVKSTVYFNYWTPNQDDQKFSEG